MAPGSIILGHGSRGTPSSGSRPGRHEDEQRDRKALTAITAIALASVLLLVATVLTTPSHARITTGRPHAVVSAVDDSASTPGRKGVRPTVVLVHGAFADASGWNDVSLMLLDKGYQVHAWANPLRGLTTDAAYLRDYLSTIAGPIVLVGHSYGGAVITEAATGNENIEALVYVAAYALAEGEDVTHANELGGGHSTVVDNLVVRPYPGASAGDGDAMVRPDRFRHIFAQDMPRDLVRVMAQSQRPAALSALVIPAGEPAWKTIPSYYLVASNDHLIPPVAQVAMARRADATWRRVDSSHVVMMRHPEATVRYILRADAQN